MSTSQAQPSLTNSHEPYEIWSRTKRTLMRVDLPSVGPLVHPPAVLTPYLAKFALPLLILGLPHLGYAEPPSPPTSSTVRGLSWDILGGGVPTSGALLQIEAGFSAVPRVSYHHSLRRGLSVGGLIGLDYGYFRPQEGFSEALLLAVPVRWTYQRGAPWTIGLRVEPGLLVGLQKPLNIGLVATAAAQVGYTLESRVIVGGGVEVPLLLNIRTGGRETDLVLPLLAGPFAEFHVTPPLALTLDAKVGPHLSTVTGVKLGLKLMVGVAYRL